MTSEEARALAAAAHPGDQGSFGQYIPKKRRPASNADQREWFPSPGDVVRPVIFGKVLSGLSSWIPVPFLLDTGADRTISDLRS